MRKIIAILALALLITVGAPVMAVGAAQALDIRMGEPTIVASPVFVPAPVPAECAGLTDAQVDLCTVALTVPAASYAVDGARIDVPSGAALVTECRESYIDTYELTVCLAGIGTE